MRKAWLFCLPLLFLPNLATGYQTQFGVLEMSDYFILPYLALILLARRRSHRPLCRIRSILLLFAVWALICTVSIPYRYSYGNQLAMTFGLLKLAKLFLYVTAAALTCAALTDSATRRHFTWSVLVSGALCGAVFLIMSGGGRLRADIQAEEGYKAANAMSVYLAMITCYIAGLYIAGYGSRRWRKWALVGLTLMLLGNTLSDGRGGWLAGICAGAYFIWHRGLTPRILAILLAVTVLCVGAYKIFPDFASEVDTTINPDTAALQRYGSGVEGFDDGGRVGIWLHSSHHIIDAPLFGTGLFHRGGESGILSNGSHNFFLQMFLETGLFGGVLVLFLFWCMWVQAGAARRLGVHVELSVKATLVVAIVGGLGGEYFYGGIGVFTLIALWGYCGPLPRSARASAPRIREFTRKTECAVVTR